MHVLHIEFEFRKGILFLRLFGELTAKTLHQLKEEVEDIIENSGIHNIVINLKSVIRIDRIGIRGLYEEYLARKDAGLFMICNSDSPMVRGFISDSMISSNIPILESEVRAFTYVTI